MSSRAAARIVLALLALAGLMSGGAAPSLARQAPSPSPSPLAPATPAVQSAAPVTLGGRTLFRFYAPQGSYTPAERAQIAGLRLQAAADDPAVSPESVTVVEAGPNRSDVRAGDTLLVTVTNTDADVTGRSRAAAAQIIAGAVRRAIVEYRAEHSAAGRAGDLTAALLGTLAFLAALVVLARATLAFRLRVERARLRTVQAQNRRSVVDFDTFLAGKLAGPLVSGVGYAAIVLGLVLTYAYLGFLLSRFPETRPYAAALHAAVGADFRTIGRSILAKLPDFLMIALIVLLANAAVRLGRLFFSGIEDGTITFTGLRRSLAAPTFRLFRILVFLLAVVAVFPYIPGSSSPAFRGISVFVGALFTLGASSVTSNLLAGIVLTYAHPFEIGDRVKIGDTLGDVIDKTDLAARVRTTKNVEVTIPNSVLLSGQIVNYSAQARGGEFLAIPVTVTAGYDVPWRRVHELLTAAALGTENVLSDPPPYVHQIALDDKYVTYELNAYTDRPEKMTGIASDLLANVRDQFEAAGIELRSPLYVTLLPDTVPLQAEGHSSAGQ